MRERERVRHRTTSVGSVLRAQACTAREDEWRCWFKNAPQKLNLPHRPQARLVKLMSAEIGTKLRAELASPARRRCASLVWRVATGTSSASTSRRARGSVGCRWPRRPSTSTAAATGPAHLLRSAEVAVAALAEAAAAAPVLATTGLAHPPKVRKRSTAQGRRGGLGRSSRPSAAPTRRRP